MDTGKDLIFQNLYKNLNKAQKEAVDTLEGPVMVIAGPGTGKTSILTLRIANILKKTDVAPENILALTFTESGAYAMRKKLVNIIGTAGYKVNIGTFHGFCNDVIKQYPERFPRIIGSTAITDVDQIALMEKIIELNDLELLKPYGDIFFYVKPALNEIKNLKREAIGVDDFEKIIEKQEKDFEDNPDKIHIKGAHKGKMKGEFLKLKEKIQKNRELLRLYSEYEKALVKEKLYDFEDMIIEVVKTLRKDNDLLLILQETFQYIMADEHQDANNAQNAVLELLSNFHKSPNLFIVGDEKQAIFRFQGASLDNFLYFQKIYPDAKLIHLEENYRSTQSILDASHSLILNNAAAPEVKRVQLKAMAEPGKELIRIVECSNFDDENAFLVNDIEEKIKGGVVPDEIAVLYRNNNDAFSIARALEKGGIPFRIESDGDILKDENIRKLILIFESINDLSNDELLGKALFADFLKLDVIDIYKVFEETRKERKKLIDVVKEKFPDTSEKFSKWASIAHNKTFVELFEMVVKESGYLEQSLSSSEFLERISVLESFFTEAKKMAGVRREYFLRDFIEHLERVREHGILTKSSKSLEKMGVRLMTAHKSKGLEFEYVYIVGAYDGHWGNKTKRSYFSATPVSEGGIDDERRLFYVALTRARKSVTITYPVEGNEGKELLPAQFIGEISEELKVYEKNLVNGESVFVSIKSKNDNEQPSVVHKDVTILNKEYLQKLFLEQGLAVTALNNYLKCPWEYFFVNLIRLPRAQTKHQMYGTAIHETLKTFFDKYREDEDMSKDELLELFEFNLNKTILSPSDLKDSLKKGRESLSKYYDTYKNTWNRSLLTEYSVKGVHLDVGDFELLLKGQLDKIEFIDERSVNVVDYKTGKKKSTNKENYQRQLTFYKLLLNLDEKGKYVMRSGELDYIEFENAKKPAKERFEVTDEAVNELIDLVKEKAKEIYNLNFWNKNCDEKECEYCALGKVVNGKSYQ